MSSFLLKFCSAARALTPGHHCPVFHPLQASRRPPVLGLPQTPPVRRHLWSDLVLSVEGRLSGSPLGQRITRVGFGRGLTGNGESAGRCGLFPGQLYSLCRGPTRLSLSRSLSSRIILLKCIYDHGPFRLPAPLPDIARFSVPLPPTAAALAATTQSPCLFPLDLHNLG